MGNLYRFVEPAVLYLLKKHGRSHGYQLCNALQEHALTDSIVDRASLYRTLRLLEENGLVTSEWDTLAGGPARHVYQLTRAGEQHLDEWLVVLDKLAGSLSRFVAEARAFGSA
jgi:PadR family transcriptional regulator, regulatory protein PadR